MLDFRIPFGRWIKIGLDWLEENLDWLFTFLRDVYVGLFDAMDWLFATPPALVIIAVIVIGALFARGVGFAVGTLAGLLFIVGVDQWDNAMDTLALVIVAAGLAILVAIPLGIWAARNRHVSATVRPIMDLLQTLPAFVYLIPAIGLFRIGVAPGIFATVLFALAPGVRLTELGIRGVDPGGN